MHRSHCLYRRYRPTMTSLLPPNATKLERNIEQVIIPHSPPRIIPTLWNARTCPESMLPWLAWSMSAEVWDPAWTVERKRASIESSAELHRYKGTPYARRMVLEISGQSDAEVVERSDYIRCDGSVKADGRHSCGGRWATAKIVLKQPITIAAAYRLKSMLDMSKRNCVHLQSIEFSAASFRCDGSFKCDGTVSCGTVNTTLN